jgi:ATP-binding cassette subfamily B protein
MRTHDEDLLRRASLFHLLPDEDFAKLRPLLQEEHYEFGDVIVRQGEPAEAFYLLIAGRARAIKAQANGHEVALGTLRPGDAFGEAALAEGGTRSATIRCSTAVDVLRLDREDFLKLVEEEPELSSTCKPRGDIARCMDSSTSLATLVGCRRRPYGESSNASSPLNSRRES